MYFKGEFVGKANDTLDTALKVGWLGLDKLPVMDTLPPISAFPMVVMVLEVKSLVIDRVPPIVAFPDVLNVSQLILEPL